MFKKKYRAQKGIYGLKYNWFIQKQTLFGKWRYVVGYYATEQEANEAINNKRIPRKITYIDGTIGKT